MRRKYFDIIFVVYILNWVYSIYAFKDDLISPGFIALTIGLLVIIIVRSKL